MQLAMGFIGASIVAVVEVLYHRDNLWNLFVCNSSRLIFHFKLYDDGKIEWGGTEREREGGG